MLTATPSAVHRFCRCAAAVSRRLCAKRSSATSSGAGLRLRTGGPTAALAGDQGDGCASRQGGLRRAHNVPAQLRSGGRGSAILAGPCGHRESLCLVQKATQCCCLCPALYACFQYADCCIAQVALNASACTHSICTLTNGLMADLSKHAMQRVQGMAVQPEGDDPNHMVGSGCKGLNC
jgi:hypothetical protein